MITIKVPATSANIGAGFDSCGLALQMYNTVQMEPAEGVHISSADKSRVPTGENNLIYTTARHLYELCGKPFTGLKLVQTNAIPQARGLGSSSACIAAGLLGANTLLGNPLNADEILNLATKLEGHPDNVAPALLGGFVVSAYDAGRVYGVRKDISEKLAFAAFIPDFKLLTKKARSALPAQVAHRDAVFNLSRAALLAAAFCEERYELLSVATKDCLHQQYRMGLVPGGQEIFALAQQLGAHAVFLSGAGPTILAIADASDDAFFDRAEQALAQTQATKAFTLHRLSADNRGAFVQETTVI